MDAESSGYCRPDADKELNEEEFVQYIKSLTKEEIDQVTAMVLSAFPKRKTETMYFKR